MKKLYKYGGLGFIALFIIGLAVSTSSLSTTQDSIKQEARQASVQPIFDVPVYKISFTKPLEEETTITRDELKDLVNLQKKDRKRLQEELTAEIENAILEEREFQNRNRYKNFLTDIEVWGIPTSGGDKVLLGPLAPKWAKFPEKVIVVSKIDKNEVRLDIEKDILAISELANVSSTVAKSIVSRLQSEGFSLSKLTKDTKSEIKLLWFQGGWHDPYPVELKWSVTVEGDNTNLIHGYDPRGILEICPIEEGRRVKVVAGYHDLIEEFKPKAKELVDKDKYIKKLEKKLKEKEKEWKDEFDELKKKLCEATKEEKEKRDISKATTHDLMTGNVKLERFWYKTAASGIFLGNSKVTDRMQGHQSWSANVHFKYDDEKAFILTNAHVAEMAVSFEIFVSRDKEVMWLLLPAISSVRYTQDSDMYGSPAQVLAIDDRLVSSWDYDCAIMVTSKVPSFTGQVKLGDSDRVKEGSKVVMVGNPSMLQKFLTVGNVANTNYSLTKSHLIDRYLGCGLNRGSYNWLLNTNFWFDTSIGTGGTSGSGVWALDGSEKGKVIAIHHAGIVRPNSFASEVSVGSHVNKRRFNSFPRTSLEEVPLEDWKKLLLGFSHKKAKFSLGYEDFTKDNPSFIEVMQKGRGQEIAGLNAGIKINSIKRFLQERGLDPKEFGWEKASNSYWRR
jgi:S1-C subfamily serine protease